MCIARDAVVVGLMALSLLSVGQVEELETVDAEKREVPVAEYPVDMSADAAWRSEAAKRIDRYRKADLTVRVVDQAGRPVRGIPVHVEMTRHAFGFGSALNIRTLVNPTRNADDPNRRADEVQYRRWASLLFNHVAPENDLKWRAQADEDRIPRANAGIQWMLERDMSIHAHVMIWQALRWHPMPKEIERIIEDPNMPREQKAELLRARSLAHIETVGKRYAGLVSEWDVLNENFSQHHILKIVHPDTPFEEAPLLLEWFAAAREADPYARLFVNDFGIIVGNNRKHKDSYDRMIRYLVEHEAPLGGIGLQAHYVSGWHRRTPEQLLETYERFGRFGVPLQITEFDMWGKGWGRTAEEIERAQADFMEVLYTVSFSHPSFNGITMWGFWDGRQWMDNSPLFREDWTPKPGYEVYRRLVFGDWWTDELLPTGPDGSLKLRAFHGRYRITAGTGRSAVVASATLEPGGGEVTLTVPTAPAPTVDVAR